MQGPKRMAFYMRLQNLPMKASGKDIYDFFTDFQVDSVHFVFGEDNEAHITFTSEEELLRALQLNNQPLCGTPVTLLLDKKEDTEPTLARTLDQQRTSCVNNETSQQQTVTIPVFDFFDSNDVKRRKFFHSGVSSQQQFDSRHEENHEVKDDVTVADVNSGINTPQPRYVIISNLACSVTASDLRAYFKGYNIEDKDIIIKRNDREADSLIAGVTFPTMDDAMRAEDMSAPLHGREINIMVISERMFKKTFGSKSGNGTQEGTARWDTFGSNSYWESYYHQPGLPRMWPGYYPPQEVPKPVPSYPPGYPRLPVPRPPGAHYVGPYYPPTSVLNMTPNMGSVPQHPPATEYLQKTQAEERIEINSSSTSIVSNISVIHMEGMKKTTVAQGGETRASLQQPDRVMPMLMHQPTRSTEQVKRHGASQRAQKRSAELHSGIEEPKQRDFYVRFNNVKDDLSANELLSKLISLGVHCKVVRVVRCPDGAVLFAYATCNQVFPIAYVTNATAMTCKMYSQDHMDKELTGVSPQCTVTEAYAPVQEHHKPNTQEKMQPDIKPMPMRRPTQAANDHRNETFTAASAIPRMAPKKRKKEGLKNIPRSVNQTFKRTEVHIRINNVKNKYATVLWKRLESLGAKPIVVRLVQQPLPMFAYATYEKLPVDKLKKDPDLHFTTSSQEQMDKDLGHLKPHPVITEAFGPVKEYQVGNWEKEEMPPGVKGTPTTQPPLSREPDRSVSQEMHSVSQEPDRSVPQETRKRGRRGGKKRNNWTGMSVNKTPSQTTTLSQETQNVYRETNRTVPRETHCVSEKIRKRGQRGGKKNKNLTGMIANKTPSQTTTLSRETHNVPQKTRKRGRRGGKKNWIQMNVNKTPS